jgi:hypothetical protein
MGANMSHRGVEIVLGRLATDEALRNSFRRSPALALREILALGVELSSVELAALELVDPAALHIFAQTLDPRLQKALLVIQGACDSGDAGEGEEP